MRLLRMLDAMPGDQMLVCWTGTLFSGRHAMMRADCLSLLAGWKSGGVPRLRLLSGYRPAAVKHRHTLGPDDYVLRYRADDAVGAIRGATSRRGRHALESDLLEGESWEPLDGECSDWSDPPGWALQALAFHEAAADGAPETARAVPLPDIWLFSPPGAAVSARPGAALDPRPEICPATGKLMRRASRFYGQGVLAVDPGPPVGTWFRLPAGVRRAERPDISVDLSGLR